MTDITAGSIPDAARPPRRDIGIKKRYAAEARFKLYGLIAILFGLAFLAIMLVSIFGKGYTAFWQTNITLPVTFDAAVLDPQNKRATEPSVLIAANYDKLAQDALVKKL
ncbi:phosphate ABC transporter, permease protein PstA, partial [Salmonella enterica subsp. enterica serovar Typhi]|nr:phosphate ABC transporter, permease protein PstA [Salmonella enterica subsp. enterica serovar Typhi]